MLILNHHHLYYFWVAAKAGSIAKACETLHLAQPTVSAQIIRLEKSLGRVLLERQKKGVTLTEEGRLVLGYADQIFNYSQELMDALHDRPGGRQRRLQIGLVDQVPKRIVESVLHLVFKPRANTLTTVIEGRFPTLFEDLKRHTLDLLLSNIDVPIEDASDYVKVLIGRFPVDLVATSLIAKQVKRFPRDLDCVPFLLPTHASPLRSQIERYLSDRQVTPHVLAEVQDAELLQRLALQGYGAAVLDRRATEAAVKAKRLVRLNARPLAIQDSVWLISKKRHRLNPVARSLLDHFGLTSPLSMRDKSIPYNGALHKAYRKDER